MTEQLNNIFVPVEVAKLAKEKGFNEWCACYFVVEANDYKINEYLARLDLFSNGGLIPIPTHHQLIEWILKEHKIYVSILKNWLWCVEDNDCKPVYNDKGECMFLINEALELALNQIKNGKI